MGDFQYSTTPDGNIIDFVTNKILPPHPEEPVRQWYEKVLVNNLGYSKEQIDIEVQVQIGHRKCFADIVVYEDSTKSKKIIIVEAKRPNRFDGRKQLDSYLSAEEVELGVWTNGQAIEYIYHPSKQVFNVIHELPRVGETIHDISNRLVRSKLQPAQDFRRIIEECEDIIVGSQGGLDVFDELFKLIFAKIYDELKNLVKDDSIPEFRASVGESHSITANRIKKLFQKAKGLYPEVFDKSEHILLSDENIHIITLKLQTSYLFKTDLDVLGEGFEVLIPSKMKLNKGQYFTPRQLVKLAVDMVDPSEEQKVLDPACGSGGFLIYCMKYVWQKIAEMRKGDVLGIQRAQIHYASNQLFGLDYDDRLVKVAKAYMTIAGDGSSNVRKVLDSLKPYDWDPSILRDFTNADILLTNPPFAGDLDLKRFSGDRGLDFVYANHKLSKKGTKEFLKQRKDILFLEKCIDYVKTNGVVAIVLPKGDLDERNKKYVRDFIKRHCKILAVIGLHETLFVPYTSQKTSLVLLQKYAKPLETLVGVDYPIFMAVSEKSGKDKSGAPVYLIDENGQHILDDEQKPILDTDLEQIGKEYRGEHELTLGFYVSFNDLEDRINAEYYHPRFDFMKELFAKQEAVLSIDAIKKSINNGIDSSQLFKSGKREYVTVGTPYLRVGDVYENFIDWINAAKVKIDPKALEENYVTKTNDILVTRKGTTGRASVVMPYDEGMIISSEIIRLSLKKKVNVSSKKDGRPLTVKINPYYVSAFLNSEIGKSQIEQKRTGGISQGINHPDLKTVEIPIPLDEKQAEIAKMYQLARQYRIESFRSNERAAKAIDTFLSK